MLDADNSLCGFSTLRFGGVAYNIASELAQKEYAEIDFISVLSNDFIGKEARNKLLKQGIHCNNSLFVDSWQSFYNEICNPRFYYGINDMRVISLIDLNFILNRKEEIQKADILIVDENLDTNVLEYIAHEITIPIFCDATSPAKCKRIFNCSHLFSTIKFNQREFCEYCELSSEEVFDDNAVISAAHKIGAERIIVTLGTNGSLTCKDGIVKRCFPNRLIKATPHNCEVIENMI